MRIVRRSRFLLLVAAITVMSIKSGLAEPASPLPAIGRASWIWGDLNSDVCQFRLELSLEATPVSASILLTADNGYELYVNGASVGYDIGGGQDVWGSLERYDIKPRLAQGRNIVGIQGICLGGMRGLVAAIRIEMPGREPLELVSDSSWHAAIKGKPEDYSHPEFLEKDDWASAKVLGPMGMAPWGVLTYAGSAGGRRQGALPGAVAFGEPDREFAWPGTVAFLGDDCSVYTPIRGDAWGVCFRVGNWSRAYTEFDLPCPSKIGRKLFVLDAGEAGGVPRVLVDAGQGVIGSPAPDYDGRTIYMAMAAEGESFFHIYRVPVDGGTAPVRLTSGPFHDIDPAVLPDGRIVFTSTRIGCFEEYHNPPSRSLFVMNADGSGIAPITFTLIFDNEPKVTADGRIAFIRTDNFFDRAKVETQIHVVHPDGSGGVTEIGANVGADYGTRLRQFGYGSPAPLPDGRLACISSRGNFICKPGTLEPAYQRLPGGLGDLAPLPDGRLLATILRPKGRQLQSDVLAVLDPGDNQLVAVYESDTGSVHSPVSLEPRRRPPVRSDVADRSMTGRPGATGYLYCQDAPFTRKNKADWAQVRAVRVLGAKGLTTRSSHSHIVHAGHETVELGVVPLAPDGSFYVEVPADMPLALQAVDAEGRSELNEMSWIYVRPGEQRSCLGCHHDPTAAPSSRTVQGKALRTQPLKLLGQGRAHRFRGNNSGVTGMMDLQFERFRENASLNRHGTGRGATTTGLQDIEDLAKLLGGADEGLKISAAQRLGLLRSRVAAPALAAALRDASREVRTAAAMALAACGTRASVSPLLEAMTDDFPVVAQAAAVALENLVGHAEKSPEAWVSWLRENPWDAIEQSLVARVDSSDRVTQRRAIVALGHVGGDAARDALRAYLEREKGHNPYPDFVKNNRTDRFTFSADSPLNPRTLQEAARALGYLHDREAVPLLSGILAGNIDPKTANLFLAEAAIEALGMIATPDAEQALIDTFARLQDYVHYVGWYSDHPALYACHASPLHARIIMALDAMGSTRAAPIVTHIIRSVPTDPDRALFPESDSYETLAGRVILRSGRGDELVATCLSLLGDPSATAVDDLKVAVSAIHGAWAGKPAPDNRASQVLSYACRDCRYEPSVRAAYERYRAKPEDAVKRPLGNPSWIPQRHWVLFYLGRTLGNLGDSLSVDALLASLRPELNEARHGRPDPAEPNIHFLQLEYTPCWRATAAWALGQIGDARAVPTLLEVVGNMDNATDTRINAAEALGLIADPSSMAAIRALAEDYPEVSTRYALLEASQQ